MRTVLALTGPINSGKTILGRAVADRLPGAAFLDGDDHDAPSDATLPERIAAAMFRIEREVARCPADTLVIAYPLDDVGRRRLRAGCERRDARLVVVTLAPELSVALTNRGGRVLTAWERRRIPAMYADGLHRPALGEITLDTGVLTVPEAVDLLLDVLG